MVTIIDELAAVWGFLFDFSSEIRPLELDKCNYSIMLCSSELALFNISFTSFNMHQFQYGSWQSIVFNVWSINYFYSNLDYVSLYPTDLLY